jgi:hypothetical protein
MHDLGFFAPVVVVDSDESNEKFLYEIETNPKGDLLQNIINGIVPVK